MSPSTHHVPVLWSLLVLLMMLFGTCSKSTGPDNNNPGGTNPNIPTRDQIVGNWKETTVLDQYITTRSQQTAFASWLPGIGQISYSGSLSGTLTYLRRYKYVDYGDTVEVYEATEKPENDTSGAYSLHIEKSSQQYTVFFDYQVDPDNSISFSTQTTTGITYNAATFTITLNAIAVYNFDDPSDSLVINGTLRSAEITVAANTKTKLFSYMENIGSSVYGIFAADSTYKGVIYFPYDLGGDSITGTWSYANGILTIRTLTVQAPGDTVRDSGSVTPAIENNNTIMTFTVPSLDYCLYDSIDYSNRAECIDHLEYEFGLDPGSLVESSVTTHVTYTRVASVSPKAVAIYNPLSFPHSARINAFKSRCHGCRR